LDDNFGGVMMKHNDQMVFDTIWSHLLAETDPMVVPELVHQAVFTVQFMIGLWTPQQLPVHEGRLLTNFAYRFCNYIKRIAKTPVLLNLLPRIGRAFYSCLVSPQKNIRDEFVVYIKRCFPDKPKVVVVEEFIKSSVSGACEALDRFFICLNPRRRVELTPDTLYELFFWMHKILFLRVNLPSSSPSPSPSPSPSSSPQHAMEVEAQAQSDALIHDLLHRQSIQILWNLIMEELNRGYQRAGGQGWDGAFVNMFDFAQKLWTPLTNRFLDENFVFILEDSTTPERELIHKRLEIQVSCFGGEDGCPDGRLQI
jgi:hypothetical protein